MTRVTLLAIALTAAVAAHAGPAWTVHGEPICGSFAYKWLPDELRQAAGHLVAMHVKDALPGVIRGVPFGEGIVPFTETFRTLTQIGFSGPLGVEMWADMDKSGDPVKKAVEARNFVEQLISAT